MKIEPKKTKHIYIDGKEKLPAEIEDEIMKKLEDVEDKIVTIRLVGQLKDGKPSDINWQAIMTTANSRGAYHVMKNSNKLNSKEIDKITIEETSIEAIEDRLLKEHGQEKAKDLMHSLAIEKKDGEKAADYERRMMKEADSLLRLSS